MKKYLLLVVTVAFCCLSYAQKRIDSTKISPYAYICKIDKYKNGIKYKATGFLIGENHILTNAHVAHNADSLFLSPGFSPKLRAPFGTIKVICIKNINTFFPDNYKSSTSTPQKDFALIKFTDNEVINNMKRGLKEEKPFFKFEVFNKIVDNRFNTKINIAGYPCFKFFELRKKNYQYYNSGLLGVKKRGMPDAKLNYKLNTRKCNSGSPLWITHEGKPIIIGIHKSGSGFKNQGVELTTEVVSIIKNWMTL